MAQSEPYEHIYGNFLLFYYYCFGDITFRVLR